MKTAVIILNWNGIDLLKKFLKDVNDKSRAVSELWLADNGSTDGSLEWIKSTFPDIRIFESGQNLGYAGGYNAALEHIDAELYVLLNSDVEVTENWLTPIIEAFKGDEALAACQPAILSYNNKEFFEHAGAAGGFIDRYGYPFCRGRLFDYCEKDEGQYNDSAEIFWASGACLAIRAGAWKKSGGFDADFFAHMEEVDLCWRLQNMGYTIKAIPDSKVYHVGGGTLPYSSPAKIYYNFRNSLYMLHKNLPGKGFLFNILKRLFLDGLAAARFLLSLKLKAFWQVLRSHIAYYGNIGKLKQKRKAADNKIEPSSHKSILNRSVALEYYIRKKKKFSSIYTAETASSSDVNLPL
ncbi:MAG: glycosyltransferase family 2 protein [Marinilabiliaceae bacterium]|nr:glycosyltransferase family 2 protein [Marinilabiliaceae bacterium]